MSARRGTAASGHGARDPGARRAHEVDANLRHILAANADGIVVVDEQGTVCYANPAAEELFGLRAEQMVGQPFGFPLVVGATTEVDVVRRGSNGGREPVVVEMRVVKTMWGDGYAYLASLRDISDRKRAEAEREQLLREQIARREAESAVRARDEFLAIVSHELKTPLTRLRLAAQRTMRQIDRQQEVAPDQVRHALGTIDQETNRLSHLVDQLLDISRFEEGTISLKRSIADIRPMVEAVVARVQASAPSHRLELRMPTQPVIASVDRLMFEKVVTNIVGNAVRYSPDHSAVGIELTDPMPADDGSDLTQRESRLIVLDHGVGIPPEYRDKIFDRFFRAHVSGHRSGVGLGLYTSRRIMELHGGRVDAEFPEHGGTCFVISIPLADP